MGKVLSGIWLAISLLAAVAPASAEVYPNHPLRLIVPFAAGGGTDFLGRVFAKALSQSMGKPVIVENRGGAGTIIGIDAVSKSNPDGYTLLVNGSTMSFIPSLFKKLPFDVAKDLRSVTLISQQPYVLVVTNSLPVKTLAEFTELAKSKPDSLAYVSAGIGSATHLASALLWRELGVQLVHIPYKGTAPAIADLVSGKVQVMYTTLAAATELIKSGQVRPLAISSAQRSETLPNVPTVAESGKPGFTQASTMSIYVPAATPKAVVDKLYAATIKAVSTDEVRNQFKVEGLQVITSKSPDEANRLQKEDIARWAVIIKEAGIQPE
jgi:tripartite-type tricarboxylate transporter receptor subunit TctC